MKKNKSIVLVAIANEPTEDGLIYTYEILQKIANDAKGRYKFDPKSSKLYMIFDVKE